MPQGLDVVIHLTAVLLLYMIQSQIVVHRFEAMVRSVGWVAHGPQLERYPGALRLPMDL